jgi:diaminopimelate decarboxylase
MNKKVSLETPCYSIDYNELEYNFDELKSAFSLYWAGPLCIGYSVKTNHLRWILEYMKQKGAYLEVVSSDEYSIAERLGLTPDKIIYNGPYKRSDTLVYAIKNRSIVNIDSFSELNQLGLIGNAEGSKIGLRVNFDLESACLGESSMGKEPSRFGFCIENGSFEKALKICSDLNIIVSGIHMHQSTRTRSINVFRTLAKKATECIKVYGMARSLQYIDIGGGFFGGRNVPDRPNFKEYAKVICEELRKEVHTEKIVLIIEPGASLVSTPISYFTKVIDLKDIRGARIVTVDGSLLHINPFLKNRQPLYTIYSQGKKLINNQIICGSTCMENDRFLNIKNAVELKVGDIIEFKKCGSYTMCYNSCFINFPPAVYVKKDEKYEKVREAWNPDSIISYL